MRLLFIAVRVPCPAESGNALILSNYLRYLGRGHEVDLIAFGDLDRQKCEVDHWCSRVVVVPPPARAASRVRRKAGLLTREPLGVRAVESSNMRRAVEALVRERQYDAIVVQLYPAAQFRPAAFDRPVILDFEDPPSIKVERTMPYVRSWRRALARIDHRRLIRYERDCTRRFDRLVFISRQDAREFGETYGCTEKVRWVPHGVASERVDGADRPKRVDGMMVVSGNMQHPPNVAGVEFICREVLGRVREVVPDATLWIVGANPTKAIRSLARSGSVMVTGWVSDVRQYLRQARVALCGVPVVVGTQTKILEALACATPVVTTSAGNHGIEATSGEQLYVADDPRLFADRIVSLLKGERWDAMSFAGQRLARDRFDWSQTGAALEHVILEAIDEQHRRTQAFTPSSRHQGREAGK
jgi:glycosyltransferase involved in cell wall biosynthesis